MKSTASSRAAVVIHMSKTRIKRDQHRQVVLFENAKSWLNMDIMNGMKIYYLTFFSAGLLRPSFTFRVIKLKTQ